MSREVKIGQRGRRRAQGGERPMGTAACGGRGFKGRATVSGDQPTGTASCRQQHTQVSCHPPPPTRTTRMTKSTVPSIDLGLLRQLIPVQPFQGTTISSAKHHVLVAAPDICGASACSKLLNCYLHSTGGGQSPPAAMPPHFQMGLN